jgi:hypothetical protein
MPSPDRNALFQSAVKDAFFDYNKSGIRQDARESLQKDAEFLSLHPEIASRSRGIVTSAGARNTISDWEIFAPHLQRNTW